MAWTTPRTWVASEVPTAANFNAHVRDNLNYLLTRPGAAVKRDNGATYTTTSASFANVDGTNLTATINIAGGKALVYFAGVAAGSDTQKISFDFTVDGTRYGAAGADGMVHASIVGAGATNGVGFTAMVTGLSVGSHTFTLQWKTSAFTASLYSGNGSGGADYIVSFGAQEVG